MGVRDMCPVTDSRQNMSHCPSDRSGSVSHLVLSLTPRLVVEAPFHAIFFVPVLITVVFPMFSILATLLLQDLLRASLLFA